MGFTLVSNRARASIVDSASGETSIFGVIRPSRGVLSSDSLSPLGAVPGGEGDEKDLPGRADAR